MSDTGPRRPFPGTPQHVRRNITLRGPIVWVIAAAVALPYVVGLIVIVLAVIERLSR